MRIHLALIVLASIIYFGTFYFFALTHQRTFRMDSDYDMAGSYFVFIIDYFREHHSLPKTHEFGSVDLPIRADPSLAFYNPMFALLLFAFGFENGMWAVIFFTFLFSGLFMYILARSYEIKPILHLWAAIMYMFSGALAARIAAGHINFIVTYPLWPLLFFYLFKPLLPISSLIIFGSILSLMFLSGDMYGLFFFSLFFIACSTFYFARYPHARKKIISQTILLMGMMAVFSSPKLSVIFFERDLIFSMTRMFSSRFGEGSIQLPITILPFLVPWRVIFYDRPFFQKHFEFYFNWYEYYAFISPLPFLFLAKVKLVEKKYLTPLFLVCGIGLLYVAQKFAYSPFFWIFQFFPFLSQLRVAQRMYIPLTTIAIILVALAANSWLTSRRKHASIATFLLVTSILWVGITNTHTLRFALESTRTEELRFASTIRQQDPGNFYVLNLLCCIQTFLIQQNIPILNFYAAWKSKKSPQFIDSSGILNLSALVSARPKYILAPTTMNLQFYQYEQVVTSPVGVLWRTELISISPEEK